MFTAGLAFLKSSLGKYIIAGAIIAGIVVYYKVEIFVLANKIEKYITTVERLENDNSILRGNVDVLVNTNKGNLVTLAEYETEINGFRENQSIILEGKDTEISNLKALLKDATRTVLYPEGKTIIVKECEIKVKEKPENEDITFKSINNIGF